VVLAGVLNLWGSGSIIAGMSLEPVLARVAQIESAIADPMLLSGSVAQTGGTAANTTTAMSTPTASAASASPTSFASLLAGAGDSSSTSSAGSLGETETLDSIYGMDALQSLGGIDDSSSGSSAEGVNPTSQLLSLLSSANSSSSSSTGATSTAALSGTSALGSVATSSGSTAAGNQAIVQIAEGQVGQAEQPLGSNNGPAIAMYRSAVAGAEPGEPWCAQFASWVAKQAGIPLGDQGQGFSAVSQIWSWAEQTGRAIPNGPGVVPQPGDLIVFGDAHVGIVTGVQANGDIDTVEGNFNNQVEDNVRSPDEATGYVNMSE
jgi:hypothetical protein